MNIHFDLLAGYYDRVMRRHQSTELGALLNLPTDGFLLDVGGGTGRASKDYRNQVRGVVISDLSSPMLAQALQKDSLLPTQAIAEALPFADNSFARIMVVDALHHFIHQPTALSELVRVLQPGGRMVIEEPDIALFSVKLRAVAEKLALMRSHFYALEKIQKMLTRTGLHAEVRRGTSFSGWVIAEKN